MKTLNLKEFKLFTDISRAGHIVVDARKEFANAIYMGMNGIVALTWHSASSTAKAASKFPTRRN